MLLHGVKKCFGVGVLGGSGWRQDYSCYQYTLLAAVGVGRARALISHFFAANISECSTRGRALGAADVGNRTMVDCHLCHLAFSYSLGERA